MNLMINNQGKWINNYIPARYRSLPFVLATDSNTNKKMKKYYAILKTLIVLQNQSIKKVPKFLIQIMIYQKI